MQNPCEQPAEFVSVKIFEMVAFRQLIKTGLSISCQTTELVPKLHLNSQISLHLTAGPAEGFGVPAE